MVPSSPAVVRFRRKRGRRPTFPPDADDDVANDDDDDDDDDDDNTVDDKHAAGLASELESGLPLPPRRLDVERATVPALRLRDLCPVPRRDRREWFRRLRLPRFRAMLSFLLAADSEASDDDDDAEDDNDADEDRLCDFFRLRFVLRWLRAVRRVRERARDDPMRPWTDIDNGGCLAASSPGLDRRCLKCPTSTLAAWDRGRRDRFTTIPA